MPRRIGRAFVPASHDLKRTQHARCLASVFREPFTIAPSRFANFVAHFAPSTNTQFSTRLKTRQRSVKIQL
jgi:hypothetical protein